MKQQYFLISPAIQRNCLQFIAALPAGSECNLMVEIREKTRNDAQNAKLHAMFSDLSAQAKWSGEVLTLEQWKVLMISAHTVATGEPNLLTVGIEGEVVNLRESSAKMSVKRMASLIEYVTAWGVQNGVVFRDGVWGE